MRSIERWANSQRIGIASYVLHVLPVSDPLFDSARQLLLGYLQEFGQETRQSFLLRLPLSVLDLLATTMRQEKKIGKALAVYYTEVEEARRQLCEGNEPPIAQAQIWAYYALLGRSSPLRLVRLGRTLFNNDRNWRQAEKDSIVVEQLASLLQVLRAPWSMTEDKLSAVGEMAPLLQETPHWAQIENIVFHQLFCWPLLVLAGDHDQDARLGISFPVAVDIDLPLSDSEFDDRLFDDPAFERIDHRRCITLRGEAGTISIDKWTGHLELSARVAKKLWRAKHGNHGDFREKIKRAKIIFDFRVAQSVAADLERIGLGQISIIDGSADAYFAQAVLNRLRGGPGILASAVTGLIGEQLCHEDGTPALNYKLIPPGGIVNKLMYAFACQNFERVVVPAGVEEDVQSVLSNSSVAVEEDSPGAQALAGGMSVQTAEVNYAHDLQDLADIVQVGGWRQYQYIRCPEVAWAIHTARTAPKRRPGLLDAKDPRVEQVIHFLASNSSRVSSLNASAVVVASALWHINMGLRPQIRPYPPPSLSWAVIRTTDGEQDTRFWQVLWRVVGASEDDFAAFLHHPSREEAVARLADALNKFEPDRECPSHRAPDIVVIVGFKRFDESLAQVLNPLSRPFMVAPILHELKRYLLGPFDNRLVPLVGKSRILLLPEDTLEAAPEDEDVQPLTPTGAALLKVLATFEGGFSQQTASLLLSEFNVSGLAVRKLLHTLAKEGVLRYGQGIYHIPHVLKEKLRSDENPNVLAPRHFAAGCALAPFVAGVKFPALALDVAFNPENLHEAEKHFALAFRYAQVSSNHTVRNRSQVAMQRLERFAELPGWGTVDRLLKSQHLGRDAYEMSTELLRFQQSAEVRSHPAHLVVAARAAAQWVKSFRGSDNLEWGQRLRRIANDYFVQALEACSYFPSEERFNRLHVLTNYTMYMIEHEPQRETDLYHYKNEAWDLLLNGVDGQAVWGEWFEWLADSEDDHSKASSLYRLGRRWKPQWAQLWVKGVGASFLAGLDEDVQEIRKALSSDQASSLLSKAQPGYRKHRQRVAKSDAVTARWHEGFRLFKEFWGSTHSLTLHDQ